MVDKLHQYQGITGRMHTLRDMAREKIDNWKEEHPEGVKGIAMNVIKTDPHSRGPPKPARSLNDYPHIYRKKTRMELIRVSAAVMGIEFSYAAETAFVSPTLLKIGVTHQHMTLVWGLSPLIGFFLTPVLGSLSDGCRLIMGRRRPFILILALGVFIGLILVPNGRDVGHALGDYYPSEDLLNYSDFYLAGSLLQSSLKNESESYENVTILEFVALNFTDAYGNVTFNETEKDNNSYMPELSDAKYAHPWGVFFTILGTVLLDFDADSCQSPARAYLLDVTLPEDHAKGLSTFTIMAGLGGFFGYALGGTNWDATAIGAALGGHVRAVFTLITVLFVICVVYTVTSFKEVPLELLESEREEHQSRLKKAIGDAETVKITPDTEQSYGSLSKDQSLKNSQIKETEITEQNVSRANGNSPIDSKLPNGPMEPHRLEGQSNEHPTLKEYLLSIIFMPHSLRMLCLTNLFCWMAHVCYSLYFTDFVGEAVFNGNPQAPVQSPAHELYEEGVRFGCWGMSMYSLSCSCYSLIIESLIKRFKARNVYVGGLLFYSIGMALMAITKDKVGVILFSWTAGVMYSTLFTMPYLLVAHYHANGVFGLTKDGEVKLETRLRGLGTDVAIVSSMVFLAQFLLSTCMGSIVELTGTTTAVVSVASALAFCGAVSATKVMYLDL